MGSRKKNKNGQPQKTGMPSGEKTPTPATPSPIPATVTAAAATPVSAAQASISKAQIITWVLAAAAICVSIYASSISSDARWIAAHALQVAEHQAEINQQNQDRATGKIAAKFDFVDLQMLNLPEMKKPFIKKFANGQEGPRIDDIHELVKWAVPLHVQNTGEEIIDSVRIEVGYFGQLRIAPDENDVDSPVVLTDTTTIHEIPLPGKLKPGEKAALFLFPLLAEQMGSLAKLDQKPDADRRDVFQIRVLAHIVGAPNGSYDATTPRRDIQLHVNWRAKGFSDADECRKAAQQQIFTMIQ